MLLMYTCCQSRGKLARLKRCDVELLEDVTVGMKAAMLHLAKEAICYLQARAKKEEIKELYCHSRFTWYCSCASAVCQQVQESRR